MERLNVTALKSEIFRASQPLLPFIEETLRQNHLDGKALEASVLAISTKIVSLSENRIIPKSHSKVEVIRREADEFLGMIGHGSYLTIKEGLLIASAGIDESNSESGGYILYPKDPFQSAYNLRQALVEVFSLKELGILLCDSHTAPLRRGVTGISLAHAGFKGLVDKVGEKDLFDRELKMTQVNVADALASAAVLCMGESSESRPLAIIKTALHFDNLPPDQLRAELRVPVEKDLYFPMIQKMRGS